MMGQDGREESQGRMKGKEGIGKSLPKAKYMESVLVNTIGNAPCPFDSQVT